MRRFLLMTSTGLTPPKYEHLNIEAAIVEGKRLQAQHNCNVKILEVVGEVKTVEVPVTRTEVQIELSSNIICAAGDYLPF